MSGCTALQPSRTVVALGQSLETRGRPHSHLLLGDTAPNHRQHMHTHRLSHTRLCAHAYIHAHIHSYVITTWLFLLNPFCNSRSQRPLVKLQLPGNENEARGDGVSSEWLQAGSRAPILLPRTQVVGQYVMDTMYQALC